MAGNQIFWTFLVQTNGRLTFQKLDTEKPGNQISGIRIPTVKKVIKKNLDKKDALYCIFFLKREYIVELLFVYCVTRIQ